MMWQITSWFQYVKVNNSNLYLFKWKEKENVMYIILKKLIMF